MRRPLPARIGSRGFLSAGTAALLAVSSLAMVVGTGFEFGETRLRDGVTWVFNRKSGEVARINGSSGKVDLKIKVPGSKGGDLEVIQRDNAVLVLDPESGELSILDVNGLEVAARTDFGDPDDLDVVLGDGTAFIVDRVGGNVQRFDPEGLQRIGPSIRAGKGLTEGVADAAGRLWIASSASGEVVRLDPDGGSGLREGVRRRIAEPGARLEISTVDDAIVVTDLDSGEQFRLDGDGNDVGQVEVDLPEQLPADRVTPPASSGPYVPIVTGGTDSEQGAEPPAVIPPATQPGGGGPAREPVEIDDHVQFDPAVALGGKLYVPVPGEGVLLVLDTTGRYLQTISVPGDGAFALVLDDGRLWVNDPDDPTALRIDEDGTVTEVEKSADDVPETVTPPPDEPEPKDPDGPTPPDDGGDDPGTTTTTAPAATTTAVPTTLPPVTAPPTTAVPPTTPPTTQPVKDPPKPKRPSKLAALTATPGDEQVTLAWTPGAGGGEVKTFQVTWNPKDSVCGQNGKKSVESTQGGLLVTGLENGCEYAFHVTAVNKVGASDPASKPATPSSAVPGAPTGVQAAVNPDGSVSVAWGPADLNGRPGTGYIVRAASGDGQHVVEATAPADGTNSWVFPGADADQPTTVTYGRTYTITVAAVTEQRGPASAPVGGIAPFTGPSGIQILGKERITAQQWRYTVKADWRGKPGTISAAGAAQGTKDGQGQVVFDAQIPWGQQGNVTFQADLPGYASVSVADGQSNPLPVIGNYREDYGSGCRANPDIPGSQMYEPFRMEINIDPNGNAPYMSDFRFQASYAYTPNANSPDVTENPGTWSPNLNGPGWYLVHSRRAEDNYRMWYTASYQLAGYGKVDIPRYSFVVRNCPGDD